MATGGSGNGGLGNGVNGSSGRGAGPSPPFPVLGEPVPPLKLAMRRARLEEAERTDVVAELRGAEIARLEMLQEAIAPIVAQIPPDVDLFDIALMPSDHPRLFVDMIAFVEMARDKRVYRFVQDTRNGRMTIAESERIDPIAAAVTTYIARRLVEREKALAADPTIAAAARAFERRKAALLPEAQPLLPAQPQVVRLRGLKVAFSFLVDLVGSAVLVGLIGYGTWYGVAYVMTHWKAS